MSLADFEILYNEPFDNSIRKRDFLKIYHQQGGQLNQESQNIEGIFVENNIYHQKGNRCLAFDITVRRNDTTNFYYDDPTKVLKTGFAFCFTEPRLSTTIGSDIEHNKFCGQVSTIVKVIPNKDGDLFSQFDNFNGNEFQIFERLANLPPLTRDTPRQNQKMLINNHTEAKKGKIKGYLNLKDFFETWKNFEKVTKILGFHPMFKTAN